MSEFLGVVLGIAIGSGLASIRPRRLRRAVLVPAVLAAGVLTSFVNGELGTRLWTVFVSFDMVLVGLGVALGAALAPVRFRRFVRQLSRHGG